jgi:hypothetical protein
MLPPGEPARRDPAAAGFSKIAMSNGSGPACPPRLKEADHRIDRGLVPELRVLLRPVDEHLDALVAGRRRLGQADLPAAEGRARLHVVLEGADEISVAEIGESTFIMNRSEQIYEREFGDGTLETVKKITAFDPDDNWSEVGE